MILIAGGSGLLGGRVINLLSASGYALRVLTRDPNRFPPSHGDAIDFVAGDVRDPESVNAAMAGVDTVISAIHGFTGKGGCNPKTIDYQGNVNLINAAKSAGVSRFILTSIHGASSQHPMELFRMKSLAEQELCQSGLCWTIVRPTAFMETWARVIGEPLIDGGKTRIFGRGQNPINFVSVDDVACVIKHAIDEPRFAHRTVEVIGSESLNMREFVEIFAMLTGKTGKVDAVPLGMMRLMSIMLRPFNPALARQIQGGIVMDTTSQTANHEETQRLFPGMKFTTVADMVSKDYASPLARS